MIIEKNIFLIMILKFRNKIILIEIFNVKKVLLKI